MNALELGLALLLRHQGHPCAAARRPTLKRIRWAGGPSAWWRSLLWNNGWPAKAVRLQPWRQTLAVGATNVLSEGSQSTSGNLNTDMYPSHKPLLLGTRKQ